jgi:ribosomal subunit interface protein
MDILIQAPGVTLNDDLKATIEEKIAHIEQYAPRALRARVRIRKVSAHASKAQFSVSINCDAPHAHLNVEERGADVLSALDAAAAKIARRMDKIKTERLSKRERGPQAHRKD